MNHRGHALLMMSSLEQAFTQAVEKASASVVSIGSAKGMGGPAFRPWWRRGIGAGVILDGEGHVLTNHHVVDDAERLLVTFPDGTVQGGTVVGGDEETDVAVVRVGANGHRAAEFGDSDAVKLGQPVLALGNPLGLSGGPTVTSGVVSSLSRSLAFVGNGQRMIQTDAAVNQGSSGGPLVNLEGRVLGILTATIPHAEGIGFALPANEVRAVAAQLLEHGRVERVWLGIAGIDAGSRAAAYYGLQASSGVFVGDVNPGSPAQQAGLQVGDLILGIEGRNLGRITDLQGDLRGRKAGDVVDLQVRRGAQTRSVKASLAQRP